MVLGHVQARRAETENMPPPPPAKGAAAKRNRLLTAIHNASRRRSSHNTSSPSSSKQKVQQAKKRSALKPKAKAALKFTISPSTSATKDVEMKDASPTPRSIPITLPKELARPRVVEVPESAIRALVEGDADGKVPPGAYIRDKLEHSGYGAEMLSVLGRVQAVNLSANVLPNELDVTVSEFAWDEEGKPISEAPSHMVAVFGPPQQAAGPSKPRKVTLYPIHDIVIASHCANLPPFPPSITSDLTPTEKPETVSMRLPVRSLCLPSPENYPHLAAYLYHKNTTILLNSMLPSPVPQAFEENQSQLASFATQLGRTYTFEKLLIHTMMVHGLWQNACALGVCDEGVWDTIELAWEVMLTALAVSSGRPSLMIDASPSGSN